MIRARIFILWALVLAPVLLRAQQQDIPVVAGTNPYITIVRGAAWGGSGLGTVVNNFIFQPVTPDEGFCLFVSNHNPINPHTFTLLVAQSGDSTQTSYQGVATLWNVVPATGAATSFTVQQAGTAGAVIGINFKTTASAQIVVRITNNSTAAGSPDTVDLFAVQTTQSSCGGLPANSVQGVWLNGATLPAGQTYPVLVGGERFGGIITAAATGSGAGGFLLDSNQNLQNSAIWGSGWVDVHTFSQPAAACSTGECATIQPMVPLAPMGTQSGSTQWAQGYQLNTLQAIMMAAQVAGQTLSWFETINTTNPTAGEVLLNDTMAATGNVSVQWQTLTISCTAACEIQGHRSTTTGTCTAGTPVNLNLYGGTRPSINATHVIGTDCSVAPTFDAAPLFDVYVGTNQPYALDLRGVYNSRQSSGSLAGLAIENISAVTGNVSLVLSEIETLQ